MELLGVKEDFPQLLKNIPISGKRILWLCLYGIAMIVRCRSLRWSFIDECLYMSRFFAAVGLTQLKKYAPEVKRNSKDRHQLVLDLWASGFHDARILATYIEDPKKVVKEQIDNLMKDIDY